MCVCFISVSGARFFFVLAFFLYAYEVEMKTTEAILINPITKYSNRVFMMSLGQLLFEQRAQQQVCYLPLQLSPCRMRVKLPEAPLASCLRPHRYEMMHPYKVKDVSHI